jgi:hypothetical protein
MKGPPLYFDPSKYAGTEDVKQVLREVYKKQRFIVIGFPRMPLQQIAAYRPGYRTTKIFQFEMGAEFEAFEYGTALDWVSQNELIASLRPRWTRLSQHTDGIFLRMRPVGAKKP